MQRVRTIRELREGGYRIAVYCGCGRQTWLDLEGLERRGFGEAGARLARRLRCQVCGRRGMEIRLHPPQPGGEHPGTVARIEAEKREKVVPIDRGRRERAPLD
jgi:hypothetical protein